MSILWAHSEATCSKVAFQIKGGEESRPAGREDQNSYRYCPASGWIGMKANF